MRGMAKDLQNRTQHRSHASNAVRAYVQGDSVGIRPPIVKVRSRVSSIIPILQTFEIQMIIS
jgi:hypothetical protein